MGGLAGSRVLGTIAGLLLKSSVVLAAGMLAAGLFRRRGASLRHFLLTLSFVGLALLPAYSVFSGGWHTRWLPDWIAANSGADVGTKEAGISSDDPAQRRPGRLAADGSPLDVPARGAGAPLEGGGGIGLRAVLESGLPALWLTGLILILGRLTAGLCGARRLTREGKPLEDSAWQRLVRRFISAVRLNRMIEIKAHPQVVVPLTWGFRRPVVILPDGAPAWTEEERSSALFHELSHVKRGDFLVMLLVRLSLALFWLNPLCWIALKRLKSEQEKACDEIVLKAGIRPSTYANHLLSFKRSVQSTRSPLAVLPGVLGMFGRSQFRERLLVILGQKMAFKEVPMKTKIAVSALAFLAVSFVGLARPQGASGAPETGLAVSEAAAVVAVAPAQETPSRDAQKAPEKQKTEEPQPTVPKKQEGQGQKDVKIIKRTPRQRQEPIEITVFDGKTEKTIKLDGSSLVLKKGEDGRTIILGSDGREIAVIGEEGTRLEIKGGRVMVLDKGEALDLAKEPKVFTVIEGDKKVSTVLDEDKKVHTVIVRTKPHLEIIREAEEPERIVIKRMREGDGNIIVTKRLGTKPARLIQVDEESLREKLADTQAVLKKIEEQKLAESSLAAQQEALRELERSLKALEEELKKKEESLKALRVLVEPKVHVTVDDEAAHAGIEVEEVTPDEKSKEPLAEIGRDAQTREFVVRVKIKDFSKDAYEKAVAKLEKELPQGYTLEPKFDEKSGTMVIKITAPRGTEEERRKVQKLVDELGAEIKK